MQLFTNLAIVMKICIATFINISDFQFRAGESGASFG